MTQEQQVTGRTMIGKVISNKMNKTIVIEIERKVKHPLYGKYMRKFSKLYAHDEANACQIGDVVEVKMCRPISKTKTWQLVQVITKTDKEVVE